MDNKAGTDQLKHTLRPLALLELHGALLGSLCPLPGRAQAQQVAQRAQLLAQVSLRHYPVRCQLLQHVKAVNLPE